MLSGTLFVPLRLNTGHREAVWVICGDSLLVASEVLSATPMC
jgi:hypothetical protein